MCSEKEKENLWPLPLWVNSTSEIISGSWTSPLLMHVWRTESSLWRRRRRVGVGCGWGGKEGGRLIHPHPFDIRLTDPLGLSDVPPVISPFSCHLTPNPSLPINPALLWPSPGVDVSFLYFFYIWEHNKKGSNFLYKPCVWLPFCPVSMASHKRQV